MELPTAQIAPIGPVHAVPDTTGGGRCGSASAARGALRCRRRNSGAAETATSEWEAVPYKARRRLSAFAALAGPPGQRNPRAAGSQIVGLRAAVAAAIERGALGELMSFCGQTAGLISALTPAADIVHTIVAEADQALQMATRSGREDVPS